MKISFIIPSYNNLRYLKSAYHSIRTWEDAEQEIVVLDDASVDGTVEWLKSLDDPNLIIWENETGKRLGHTITYDIGVDLCTTEVFSIFHADMFIGPNYVQNLVKHLDKQKVVAATRIEPPLHPSGREKITRDFGVWPEDFREDDFIEFKDWYDKTDQNISPDKAYLRYKCIASFKNKFTGLNKELKTKYWNRVKYELSIYNGLIL